VVLAAIAPVAIEPGVPLHRVTPIAAIGHLRPIGMEPVEKVGVADVFVHQPIK
jgi:hypothetical protein